MESEEGKDIPGVTRERTAEECREASVRADMESKGCWRRKATIAGRKSSPYPTT
jgi:hypothetical protein